MSILNYRRIREKWHKNIFMFHSLRRVVSDFETDSTEVLLFENLLADFCKNRRINNEYILMRSLDYDKFEKTFYDCSNKLMSELNHSEDTDYQILYHDNNLYVKLM